MSVEPPKGPDDHVSSDDHDDAPPSEAPAEGAVLSLRVSDEAEGDELDDDEEETPLDDDADLPWSEDGPPGAYDVESLPRGTQLGRFVLLGRLSPDGEESVLYGAYDPETDRKISLKLFDPGGAGEPAQSLRMSLVRQAQTIATLDHPCVERIHEAGVYGPWIFLATEFIDGIDLLQWMEVRDEPFPWPEVLRVFREAGRGLAAAHKLGIVHRDFRPGNVLMGEGRIVVIGFGLAPEIVEQEGDIDISELRESLGGSNDTEQLPHNTSGTPGYIAPEHHITGQADARSDQFSFCVALYEALYGERPFSGNLPRAIAREAANHKVRPAPEGSDVPSWLRAAVLRGLSPRPSDRFESMEHLLRELARDPAARRRRWAWGAAAAATAIALGTVVAMQLHADANACDDTGTALASVWTTERRQALQESFDASARPWAEGSWRYTESKLDTWSEKWRNYSHLACMSTRVWGDAAEQMYELRVHCLDRKLAEFETTLDVLQSIDGHGVDHAHVLAQNLPEPRRCIDTAAIVAGRSSDEEGAETLEDLHTQLSALEARQQLGDSAAVRRELDALRPEILATEDPIVIARSEVVSGLAQLSLDADLAQGTVHEAARTALRAGDNGLAATAWRVRMEALIAAGRFDEAIAVGDYSGAVLEHKRFGWLVTSLETALGQAEAGRGRPAKALAHFHNAVQKEDDRSDTDRLRLLPAWLGQAKILAGRNKHDEALGPLQAALEAAHNALGPKHPATVELLRNLGQVHRDRGELADARAAFDEALEILRSTDAPPSSRIPFANAVGTIDIALDNPSSATPYFEEALAATTPGTMEHMAATVAVAQAYVRVNRPSDAHKLLAALLSSPAGTAEIHEELAEATLLLASLEWDKGLTAAARTRVSALVDRTAQQPELQTQRREAIRWLEENPQP